MHEAIQAILAGEIYYPESDGKPMSDNTKQFEWIMKLAANLRSLFADRDDVFVSGNQFWYPVEGEPTINASPDVYVVFGRPKGHRRSYKQWEEGNIPMTVVFEVLSPSNTHPEMADKYTFYEEYGVEEYYIYDPEEVTLEAYIRQGTSFRKVRPLAGHVSPLLGIRFDLPEKEEAVEGEETVESPEMIVRYPDGQPFLAFEVVRQAEQELRQENSGLRESLEQAERQAEAESQRAETERERAEAESQRAEAESQRADQAQQRLARISELTARVLSGQATEEERLELNGYLAQSDE